MSAVSQKQLPISIAFLSVFLLCSSSRLPVCGPVRQVLEERARRLTVRKAHAHGPKARVTKTVSVVARHLGFVVWLL